MLTQDRPIIVGDAPTDRNHEFLFIEGDRIVGAALRRLCCLRLEGGPPCLPCRSVGLMVWKQRTAL